MGFFELLFVILSALVITLIVELAVAFLFGFKKKEEILAIIAINLITNPAANYFVQLNAQIKLIEYSFYLIFMLEAIIVLGEFLLLLFMLKQPKQKLFILSLLINLASFLIGALIQKII